MLSLFFRLSTSALALSCLILLGSCEDDTYSALCGPGSCKGCCKGGNCMDGNLPTACGANGLPCTVCPSGYTCLNGKCSSSSSGTCTNCSDGCCQGSQCVHGGNLQTACGKNGMTCRVCPTGTTCQNGICTTGGTCSCTTGCCYLGQCYPGNTRSACGRIGTNCETCDSNEECINNVCQVSGATCNQTNCSTGCCNSSGCQPGTQQYACGWGGNPCTACGSTQICNPTTKQCTSSGGCTGCSGCCLSNSCMPGNHPMACGYGGIQCKQCPTNYLCQNGQCVPQGSTTCSSTICPMGCCDAQGCHQPYNDTYCGLNGMWCDKCTVPTEKCQQGNCITVSQTCKTQCASIGCCIGETCRVFSAQDNSYCGSNGYPCQPCPSGTVCDKKTGTCVPSTPTCNCPGGCCPVGTTTCLPAGSAGQDNNKCGNNGSTCKACNPLQTCVNGVCTDAADKCNGCTTGGCCIDPSVGCLSYADQTNTACGTGGIPCENCTTTSKVCDQLMHTCVPGAGGCTSCTPTQCCSNNNCVTGYYDSQCGSKGEPCENCTLLGTDYICKDESGDYNCKPKTTTTCSGCSFMECCDNGTCTFATDSKCGANGSTCIDCGGDACDYGTGTCSASYEVCLFSVTIDASVVTCDVLGLLCELEVKYSAGGLTKFVKGDAQEDLTTHLATAYFWSECLDFPLSEAILTSAGVNIEIYDCDGSSCTDFLGDCTLYPKSWDMPGAFYEFCSVSIPSVSIDFNTP